MKARVAILIIVSLFLMTPFSYAGTTTLTTTVPSVDPPVCNHVWIQVDRIGNVIYEECALCGATRNYKIDDSKGSGLLIVAAAIGVIIGGGIIAIIGMLGGRDKPPKEHQHTWESHFTVDQMATFEADGLMSVHCSQCSEKTNQQIIPKAVAVIDSNKLVYSGNTQTPKIICDELEESVDYEIESGSSKAVGLYSITMKLIGTKYSGEQVFTYKIVPKATSITSLKSNKKSITVKWKKVKAQTSGYQIRYSLSKDMKNSKKTYVKDRTYKKITILSAKKKYYIQVRAYKNVNSKNYYSSWSAKKSITVK